MAAKIKIVKEQLDGQPITGKTWQITSIIRQRIALNRENSRRESEKREREMSSIRRVGAQFIKAF